MPAPTSTNSLVAHRKTDVECPAAAPPRWRHARPDSDADTDAEGAGVTFVLPGTAE
jgi:hypothetical protein